MPGRVLLKTEPIFRECLMSLVTRAATRNVLPSSHVILKQVGAPHAHRATAATSPHVDHVLLADILHLPVLEISRRMHPIGAEAGFADFFGVMVRLDEIDSARRRFAPAALRTSAHIRALWTLRTAPCCTETWQYLDHHCRCGAPQGWRHAGRLDRCDRCNARLDQQHALTVEPALRPGLSLLLGLVDPDECARDDARRHLPAGLRDQDGGLVYELALALMPLASGSYLYRRGSDVPHSQLERHAAALASAAELVKGWPGSLVPALEKAVEARSRSRSNVRYTGISDYIPALAADMLPEQVRRLLQDALEPITAAPGATPPDQIGMMDTVALTGRAVTVLAPARRSGLLRMQVCLRAGRVFPTLNRAEVERILDFGKSRMSAEAASAAMRLPQYAFILLADEGLIEMEKHPFLVERYDRFQLHRDTFHRFLATLRSAAVPDGTISEPVPMLNVARGIGGGLKPWGRIFGSLVQSRVPFTMSGNTIRDIAVHRRDVALLRRQADTPTQPSMRPPRCSQRDAIELLNLNGKKSGILRGMVHVDADWRMDWTEVLELAGSHVTLAELSARFDVPAKRMWRMLEDRGNPRHSSFGWNRSVAMECMRTP